MNKHFGLLWLAWVVNFLVLETFAASNKTSGDTLSEWVWHIIRHPVVYFPFAGFLIWIVLHFLTKGKVGAL